MVENLDLALRVRADMRQALAQTRGLQAAVRGTGVAGRRAGRGVRAFGRAWRDAGADLERTRRRLFGIRSLIAGLGAGLALRGIVRATGEQEQAVAAVADGIRRLGENTQLTTAGLQEMAAGLQQITTFGDETILRMQSLLLTFRNIDGSHFDRVTEAALNLATVIGQEPRDAALQLAKALEDPIQGLTALRRSGTVFSAAQTDVIRKLHETGRVAEAQGLILDELERQYGGAARAARDTLAGSLAALRNAFGDLFEVGEDGTSAVREAVEELIRTLQDPAVREGFQALARGALSAIGGIANALAQLNLQVQGDDSPLARLRSLMLELEGGFLFREIQFPNVWDSLFSDEALREAIADVLPDLAAAGEQLSAPLANRLRELGIDIASAIAAPLQRELDAANRVVVDSSRELQGAIANIRQQQADLPFIVGEQSREAANEALAAQLARAEELQRTIAEAEARIRDLNEEIAVALSRLPAAEEEAETPAAPAPAPLADVETRTRTEIRAGERLVDIRKRTERRLLAVTGQALAQLERDHAEAHERINRLEEESGDREAANAARLAQDELYFTRREQLLQERLDAEAERKAEAAERDRQRREDERRQIEAEQEHIARLLRDPQEAYRRDVEILQRLVAEGAQAETPFAEAARDAAVYGESVEESVGRAFERAGEDVRAFVIGGREQLRLLADDARRLFGFRRIGGPEAAINPPGITRPEGGFTSRQMPALAPDDLVDPRRVQRLWGEVVRRFLPDHVEWGSSTEHMIRDLWRLFEENLRSNDIPPQFHPLPIGGATEEYMRDLLERLDAIDRKAAEQIDALRGGDQVVRHGDPGFLTPDNIQGILERTQRELFRGFREVGQRGYFPPVHEEAVITPAGVARLLAEQEARRQATAESNAAREAARLQAREDAKEAAREEYFRRQAEEERSQFNLRREAQELIRQALEGLGGQLRIDPDLSGLPGVGRRRAPAEQDFPAPDIELLERELQRQIRELIDEHQRYIDNLRELGGGGGGDAVPGFRPAALRETADGLDDISRAVQQIPAAQTLREFRAILETLDMTPEATARAEAAFISLRLNLLDTQTTLEAGFERGLLLYANSAADAADLAERAVVGAFSGMEDALVQFVSTGKVDFKSLADSIIADLARIAIQQSITGPLANAILGGLPSIFTGGDLLGVGHGGGIAGSLGRRRAVNPALFLGAPRFHAGGIAGDEVPIIARRGEGVFTPEQMRAMGGGGPRQVRVDIRNQGTPQQVEEASASFDLDAMVISIVTRDLATGGDTARAIESIVPAARL